MPADHSILHSVISIRIVLAFLEFLSCVQSSEGVDKERIENLKKSLVDIFKIKPSIIEEIMSHVSSRNFFNSDSEKELGDQQNAKASDMPSSLSNIGSTIQIGLPLVSLFHEFHMAIAAVGFYDPSIGEDYLCRKLHAKWIFKNAIRGEKTEEPKFRSGYYAGGYTTHEVVMARDGYETFDDKWDLADALKTLGDDAMRHLCYGKALEMYSCALALWSDNAIFLCNRGAAFTKVGRFEEAILDCNEAIRLEPTCLQAYYHLGCAYFGQGSYFEAIREGFIKALQLDPNNEAALASLQRADNKMKEEASWVKEQTDRIRSKGFNIPMTNSNGPAAFEGQELEAGGNGPWEGLATEDDGHGDTIRSVADNFIDPPPK